jgi:hypothetical protein
MHQGEMGVPKFETTEASFKHRDDSHALKRKIAGMNEKFKSGKIFKSKYDQLVGVWCANVESFADEWSNERVPFDIRDAYNNCVEAIGRRGILTWPDSVPIQIGVDFTMSGRHITTYTNI